MKESDALKLPAWVDEFIEGLSPGNTSVAYVVTVILITLLALASVVYSFFIP